MKLTKEQQKALKRLWDRDKADALREKLSDRKGKKGAKESLKKETDTRMKGRNKTEDKKKNE